MPASSLSRLAGSLVLAILPVAGLPADAWPAEALVAAGPPPVALIGAATTPAARNGRNDRGRPATFPSFNDPATGEHHPGKFVWADLFTTEPAAATTFYCELFGWTATTLDQNGQAYTVFRNGGRPVAGLAPRPPSNYYRPSRWIGYIAVNDIEATLALVTKAGGQVRAPARAFPKRGSQAIIADNEGASVGLLQSSSGDPTDNEPTPGDWNWFELFVRNPQVVAAFYRDVFKYASKPDLRTERKSDYLLASGKLDRAGVAPLPDRADAKSGWICIVRVADLNTTLIRAVALDGEVLLAPRAAAYETRFAIIADSTGGAIGLVEYVDNNQPATHP